MEGASLNFDRQTRLANEGQVEEEPEPEPEPEDDSDGGGLGSRPARRCCITARSGLACAAAAQLGLCAAAVLAVAPTWPGRSSLLAWKCVVFFAVWLSAALENRAAATVSFFALCLGAAALLGLWSASQPSRALCEEAYQHTCAAGTREGCCYRCTGFPGRSDAAGGTPSAAAWDRGCGDRMVADGKFCWYPEWCDSDAAGAAYLFGGASALNACLATCMSWCQWTLLAPRTKVENVEARAKSFAGKSMMEMGKSMSQMPSFLFRPQKAGGAMQQARVTPAPTPKPVRAPAPAPKPSAAAAAAAAKKPPKPAKKTVIQDESEIEMLERAARLAARADEVEKTRQKAAEQSKSSRKGEQRKGPEGMALQISATTGSIIMNPGATQNAEAANEEERKREKREKKERREKREKRKEKEAARDAGEAVPRPSKGSKKSGDKSKRRPKVGT